MDGSLGIFSIFAKLFFVAVIFFLAYVVTKFIGTKQMNRLKGKNILIIESISLGFDKVIHLVKIGNQYFLISTSGKNISFLSQVDSSNITVEASGESGQQIINFGVFSKYLDSFKDKLGPTSDSTETTSGMQTVLQTNNIDKNVEKIKNIFVEIKNPDLELNN